MQMIAPCDLCQQNNFENISQHDRHGNRLDTVVCCCCGLVRHAEVPTEEQLNEFYATAYRQEYCGERNPGPRRIMRAWRNAQRICRQVAPLLPCGGRVLEVGAGIGCTVKAFERQGFQSEGIDPCWEFLSFSREKLRATVKHRPLCEMTDFGQYDVILLVHVIEHLRSPRESLTHIAKLLKPGGMLYIECPNLQAPFARFDQLFHRAHIFNFVPSTLKMMGEATGFTLRKRFGDSQDTNLQMLFQHSGTPHLQIDQQNCDRTLADLRRSRAVPYYLRWRYLTDRVAKVTQYANEHLTARRFVDWLVDDCSVADQPVQLRSDERRAA